MGRAGRDVREVARGRLLPVAGLCLALVLGACSSDEEPDGAVRPSSGASAPAATPGPAATSAALGTVRGRLAAARRTEVLTAATAVVDGWIDGAYGGDLPRTDMGPGFAAFTGEAREEALAQPAIMSNAPWGAGLESVSFPERSLELDVVAARGTAVGATARVRLRMTLTGDVERTDVVAGRLFLTPTKGGWRVFGFDVRRDEEAS